MYKYDDPRWYEEKYPEHSYSIAHNMQDQDYPSQTADDHLQGYSLLSRSQNETSDQALESQASFLDRHYQLQRVVEQFLIVAPFIIIAFWIGWFSQQFYSNWFFSQSNQSKVEASLIQTAWNKIDQNYVDHKDLDYNKMAYAAINAMVQSLGDTGHSRFVTPQEEKKENQQLSGKFSGIGIYLLQDPKTKNFVISATIPGSPAQKANLQRGDILVAINGMNMKGKDINSAINLIQGPAGTSITLTIQKPGEEHLRKISLTRSDIQITNVTMYYIPQTHIADIQIVQFSAGVTTQLQNAINQAKHEGASKIILDLRNNPGGYLQEAINTTSLFVKKGNVLLEQDRDGKRTPVPVNSHENSVDTSSQIVILVNRNTASAAEIVSGALQDNHRAILIGQKTFGTGTILGQFPLPDGSVLYLGTQEWLTPNGHFIRQIPNEPGSGGINPNIVVLAKPNTATLTPTYENQQHLTEYQLLNSGDVQLVAALQYLTK